MPVQPRQLNLVCREVAKLTGISDSVDVDLLPLSFGFSLKSVDLADSVGGNGVNLGDEGDYIGRDEGRIGEILASQKRGELWSRRGPWCQASSVDNGCETQAAHLT